MPVLFISTHLDHDSARAQDESSRQILKFLGSASGGPSNECPTIVVGDFNSDASGEIHQRFVKGPPVLYDAWEETHGGPGKPYENGTFHDFTGKALGEVGRIDWILFNRPLKPIEAGLLRTNADGRYPSDHFPVFATFIKT
jgi:endonuclease/exonuclease/phosphatase family metal-dependent hydrolase